VKNIKFDEYAREVCDLRALASIAVLHDDVLPLIMASALQLHENGPAPPLAVEDVGTI
jgi:hypothetical protein